MNTFLDIMFNTKKILNSRSYDFKDSLDEVCKLLKNKLPHFDWVGFYFANHKKKGKPWFIALVA